MQLIFIGRIETFFMTEGGTILSQSLIIDPEFWNLFPDATIGVLVDHDLNNTGDFPADLLTKANETAQQFVQEDPISANPIVADWRKAYQQFKTKKGARSSIEALMKRAKQGKPVTQINPLVDLYDVVSLSHGFPVGGENTDSLVGDMHLTLAKGGESFLPLGEDENDPALPGEVVYADDDSIVCRCWNWRDGQRTMLTEDTKNAILVVENVNPSRNDELKTAMADLAALAEKYVGGQISFEILDKDHPTFTFNA